MDNRAQVREFLMSSRANVSAEEALSLFVHTAEPGSESRQKLQLLGPWSKIPAAMDDRTQSSTQNH